MENIILGSIPDYEGRPGIPARVTAVHKQRYQILCTQGETYAQLKTREYYLDGEVFPTTGDYVMIDYIPNGDSRILSTCPEKPASAAGTRTGESRWWRPILTMSFSCSPSTWTLTPNGWSGI